MCSSAYSDELATLLLDPPQPGPMSFPMPRPSFSATRGIFPSIVNAPSAVGDFMLQAQEMQKATSHIPIVDRAEIIFGKTPYSSSFQSAAAVADEDSVSVELDGIQNT